MLKDTEDIDQLIETLKDIEKPVELEMTASDRGQMM